MGQNESGPRRCAIYTRKSSESGLEQEFNSLAAQRQACAAYIQSQASQGWQAISTSYGDGAYSGGSLERPSLQRLLADIRAGLVDVVVVYKIDRLTRSLTDFGKLVEICEAHSVSLVSVTQQFNTTSSMGRLTLNMLLSFAQYERELSGERIRDKLAASKRQGIWMGGMVPLGYDVRERRLIINPDEATELREMFGLYLQLGSVSLLKRELDRRGLRSKMRVARRGTRSGGCSFSRGALYSLLSNPIYIGDLRHKGTRYPGRHSPIIERRTWEQVQQRLRAKAALGATAGSTLHPANWLAGKLFDSSQRPLTTTYTVRHGRHYRYYCSTTRIRLGSSDSRWRLPARQLERTVALAMARILEDVGSVVTALRQVAVDAGQIRAAVERAGAWSRRLKAEPQLPAAGALLKRVVLKADGLELALSLDAPGNREAPRAVLTRSLPMRLKRRGVELRLVLDGQHGSESPDTVLLKAVARARHWFEELRSGRASSLDELAQRAGVGKRYVSQLLPLAFLAPAVIDAIAAGRHPVELTTDFLVRYPKLPHDWAEQERLFLYVGQET